jgi:hypothetical protein
MLTRSNIEQVVLWVCTAGMATIMAWAFGVGAEIRLLSGMPARVTSLEERINGLERQVTRNETEIESLRRDAERRK